MRKPQKGKTIHHEDVRVFTDGQFTSSMYLEYGFTGEPYRAWVEGDVIHFQAKTISPTHGKMNWKGTLHGVVLVYVCTLLSLSLSFAIGRLMCLSRPLFLLILLAFRILLLYRQLQKAQITQSSQQLPCIDNALPGGGSTWLQILSETEVELDPALSGEKRNSFICSEIADPARIADQAMTAGRAPVVIRSSIAETD